MNQDIFTHLVDLAKKDKQNISDLLDYYLSVHDSEVLELNTIVVGKLYEKYGWCDEMIDLIVFCCTIDNFNGFNGLDWLIYFFQHENTDLFEPFLDEQESNFKLFEPYLDQFLRKYFIKIIGDENLNWKYYSEDYYEDWHTKVLELIFPLEDGETLLNNLMDIFSNEQIPTKELLLSMS